MSDRDSRGDSPLQDIAYDRIRDDIFSCALAPNELLTEVRLASRYDMGKASIRSGLLRLCHEGILKAKARRGYIVSPVTVRDIQEIFQLRLILEPWAARMAAGRLQESLLAQLYGASQLEYSPEDPESVSKFLDANKLFHVSIAKAAGNRRIAHIIGQLLDEMKRLLHLGLVERPRGTEFSHEHRELLEALIAGHDEKAAELTYRQIKGGQEMVLKSAMSMLPIARSGEEEPFI